MTVVFLDEGIPIVHPAGSPKSLDTVRALCHDLCQTFAAILPLAGPEGGDVRRRLDGILDQAQWLVDIAVAAPVPTAGGMVARIVLPGLRSRAVAS